MKRLLTLFLAIAMLVSTVALLSGCDKLPVDDIENIVTPNNAKDELTYAIKDDDTYAVSLHSVLYLSDVTVPASYKGKAVTEIFYYPSNVPTNITKLTIPASVTTITEQAFSCCPKLDYIDVSENNTAYTAINGSLYTKDGNTLVKCALNSKTSFTITENVTAILPFAFENCSALETLLFEMPRVWMYGETLISEQNVANSIYMARYASDHYSNSYTRTAPPVTGSSSDYPIVVSIGSGEYADYFEAANTNSAWIEFTPLLTGVYTFEFSEIGNDVSAITKIYIYSSGFSLINVSDSTIINQRLNAGTKYYYRVTCDECDAEGFSVSLSFNPKGNSRESAYDLTTNGSTSNAWESLAGDGASVWFKFNPDVTGNYKFSVTGTMRTASIYVYEGDSASAMSYFGNTEERNYYLSQSTNYYVLISFGFTDVSSFGINVQKLELAGASENSAIELQIGANAEQTWGILEDKADEIWFKVKPAVDGYYSFAFENSKEAFNPSYTVYRGEWLVNHYSTYSVSESYGYYNLDSDYSYFIRVYNPSYSAFAVNVNILAGTNVNNAVELDGENPTTAPYSYRIHYSSNNGMYFEFTPDTAGFYTFDVSGFSNLSYLSLYIYNESNPSSFIAYNSGVSTITAELSADTTYYIRAYYSYNTSSSFDVTANVSEATAGAMRDAAIEINLGENEAEAWKVLENQSYMYFKFAPEVSGAYTFTLSDGSGYNPYYIYTSVTGSSYISSYTVNGQYVWYMSSGTTYYLYYSLYIGYGEFGINASKVELGTSSSDAINLEDGVTIYAGYNSNFNFSGEVWFEFTPSESGNYRFYVSNANRRYFYIYNSSMSTVYSMSSYTTSSYNEATVSLTAGETYYAVVDFYSSSYYDSSFDIIVSASTASASRGGTSFSDAIVMSSGTAYTANITTGGQYVYFRFTAAWSGTYTFYSSGNYDTYGTLCNSSQSQIAYNDDGGEGNNFSMSYSMSAGETVYLVARMYNGSTTGSFYVYVN